MGTKLQLEAKSFGVLLHTRVNRAVMHYASQKAGRKCFECFHHKDIINV
jgi:hypothetical protein